MATTSIHNQHKSTPAQSKKEKKMRDKICFELFTAQKTGNLALAQKIITDNCHVFDILNSNNIFTLLLRFHLQMDNIEQAMMIFQQLIISKFYHKRHVFLFVEYFVTHDKFDELVLFFAGYWKHEFQITAQEIEMLLDTHNFQVVQLLKIFVSHPIRIKPCYGRVFSSTIENFTCPHCQKTLQKMVLTCEERQTLIAYTQKKIHQQKKHLKYFDTAFKCFQATDYDMVLDGANILNSTRGQITPQSYHRLMTTIETLSRKHKVLLILHQRHFRLPFNWAPETKKEISCGLKYLKTIATIYQTPSHVNDDLFFLLACFIKKQCFLVSNDLLRDHIFASACPLIQTWYSDYVLHFTFPHVSSVLMQIDTISPYSERIQLINDKLHIPTTDKRWLCLES